MILHMLEEEKREIVACRVDREYNKPAINHLSMDENNNQSSSLNRVSSSIDTAKILTTSKRPGDASQCCCSGDGTGIRNGIYDERTGRI